MPQKSIQISCAQLHWAKPIEYNLERTLYYIQRASFAGSRVILFPESSLTGYYFPYASKVKPSVLTRALNATCKAAASYNIWAIVGSIEKAGNKFWNLAHVINPQGKIVHEYAKVNLAGKDEKKYCLSGNKLSLFEIDGILCTLVICRDGRHPELYRIPAMAGAQILFHPSCSSDEIEAVAWKRTSGRAQQPVGPNSKIFHCVANTIGQNPEGNQTSSGWSFIREPGGIPLAEAGFFQEELITATLDITRADRSYVKDSMQNPPFLRPYWKRMVHETIKHAHVDPRK